MTIWTKSEYEVVEASCIIVYILFGFNATKNKTTKSATLTHYV